MIYTHDHPPAHAHLVGPNGRAKVLLNCPSGPPVPLDIRGIDKPTMRRLMEVIAAELSQLCEGWENIHGRS
ncbi:DUF4160 domain-containing protein [Sulfuritortus calidifontis]|uniref:DUF4160 domain-containing protein n=1 Tax=Sulfuritortus calidifontis TaxID=1914471 RepID=UPI003B848301